MFPVLPKVSKEARRALLILTFVFIAHVGIAVDLGPGEWVQTSYAKALCATHDPNGRCEEWCARNPATGVDTPTGIVCILEKNGICDPKNIISKGPMLGRAATPESRLDPSGL